MIILAALGVFAALLAWLGVVQLRRGWRGHRLGDHPYCQRCGFDLFGRSSDSQVCSECGADLAKPGAVEVGIRKPHIVRTLAGAIIFFLGIGILMSIFSGYTRNVNWNAHKPVWWLAIEAESADPNTSLPAQAELLGRMLAGSLTSAQATSLINRGLAIQGQTNRNWPMVWGRLIEAAKTRRMISKEQWQTYARQSIPATIDLETRKRYRPDDPFRYRIPQTLYPARSGQSNYLHLFTHLQGFVVDGKELMPRPAENINQSLVRINQPGLFKALSRGPHSGYLRFAVKVTDDWQFLQLPDELQNAGQSIVDEKGAKEWGQRVNEWETKKFATTPGLADVEIKVPVQIEIIAPDELPVTRLDDEKLRGAVESSIAVDSVKELSGAIEVQMICADPPIGLSYAVLVRDGVNEVRIGTMLYKRETLDGRIYTADPLPPKMIRRPMGAKVTLVLRPDPEPAMEDPTMADYWGGEVVIKDVPVSP